MNAASPIPSFCAHCTEDRKPDELVAVGMRGKKIYVCIPCREGDLVEVLAKEARKNQIVRHALRRR